MELALSLEKLTSEKLLHLHSVADKNKDVQLANFVETKFLIVQVEAIKKIAEHVAQLRGVGKGREFQGTVVDDTNKRKRVIVENDQDADDLSITAYLQLVNNYKGIKEAE